MEVQVPRADVELMRALATLLRDAPTGQAREELRALLRAASGARALKELLATTSRS